MSNLQIEGLAYWLWQQRGMPEGSPEQDWFLAEKMLGVKRETNLPSPEMPLFAFGIERRTK